MSLFHPVTLQCCCSRGHNHHNIHRNTSLAVFKQSEREHASETDRIHIHTPRYNYRGVSSCSWKDASSNCVVCTSRELGPYACSQRGSECGCNMCWGKGVLLGVAPVLVYIETDRYQGIEILKTVGGSANDVVIPWHGCVSPGTRTWEECSLGGFSPSLLWLSLRSTSANAMQCSADSYLQKHQQGCAKQQSPHCSLLSSFSDSEKEKKKNILWQTEIQRTACEHKCLPTRVHIYTHILYCELPCSFSFGSQQPPLLLPPPSTQR